MSKKTKQTNTVAWSNPPATAATTALQGMVGQGTDYATPLRSAYAREKVSYDKSFNNPLGGLSTATIRDNSKRAHGAEMGQRLGMDLANAAQRSQAAQFGQQATVAGLTSPQMYQSGSTTKQSDPFGMAMALGGLGTSALTGGLSGSGKG